MALNLTTSVPTADKLKNRLTRLLSAAVPFAGTVYRSCTPQFASESDLLNGEGSKRFGARWNPAGVAVVYASITPETAMAETLAHHRYYGILVEDAMPRTFVALVVKLKAVLDLRQSSVRQRLHVALDSVLTVDWRKEVLAGRMPVTQAIGQAAFHVGLEALIVPSAADLQGSNLLVFPANLPRGNGIRVMNADRLAS